MKWCCRNNTTRWPKEYIFERTNILTTDHLQILLAKWVDFEETILQRYKNTSVPRVFALPFVVSWTQTFDDHSSRLHIPAETNSFHFVSLLPVNLLLSLSADAVLSATLGVCECSRYHARWLPAQHGGGPVRQSHPGQPEGTLPWHPEALAE